MKFRVNESAPMGLRRGEIGEVRSVTLNFPDGSNILYYPEEVEVVSE